MTVLTIFITLLALVIYLCCRIRSLAAAMKHVEDRELYETFRPLPEPRSPRRAAVRRRRTDAAEFAALEDRPPPQRAASLPHRMEPPPQRAAPPPQRVEPPPQRAEPIPAPPAPSRGDPPAAARGCAPLDFEVIAYTLKKKGLYDIPVVVTMEGHGSIMRYRDSKGNQVTRQGAMDLAFGVAYYCDAERPLEGRLRRRGAYLGEQGAREVMAANATR